MQKGAANKEDRRRKMTGKKKKDKDEEDKEETGDTNADKWIYDNYHIKRFTLTRVG